LLEALGVSSDRVVTTGDDAIEPAYAARPTELGRAIGVNVRVGSAAGVDDADIAALGPVLRDFAQRFDAPLLPVPIARQQDLDAASIERLLDRSGEDDGGRSLDTPRKVIEQVGRCRVVVTGAYHAAVFALSQGIPAVCLTRSSYYDHKFFGLADLFGDGCTTVSLHGADAAESLRLAVERAWKRADEVRAPLLQAAEDQIVWSREAFMRARNLVEARLPIGRAAAVGA
jgi:colanic acid/amylovoran biosynthesis protein